MKKLGFTLIELLAVILILGIIALIAIPTINNIMKESKKGAFKSSVQNIALSIEQKCRMQQLKGEEIIKYYRFEDGVSLTDAGFKGEIPADGSIVVDDECNVDIVVNKENYIAIKSKDDDMVTIMEDKYYVPGTHIVYNPGDVNFNNWYVIKDNGETVTLLSSRNLFSNVVTYWVKASDYVEAGGTSYNEVVGYNDLGPLTVFKQLENNISTWNIESKENIRIIKLEEILEVLGINDFKNYVMNLGNEIYFDTKTNIEPMIEENYESKYYWLFNNMKGCLEHGCKNDSQALADSSYWINGTILKGINACSVTSLGLISCDDYFKNGLVNFSNIRPVITIPKSSINNN